MPSDILKPSQAKTAINLLTLPRELRQRILILTLRVPPTLRFKLSKMIIRHPSPDPDAIISKAILRKRRRMRQWTKELEKVHEVVAEDMEYVRQQWKKSLDGARAVLQDPRDVPELASPASFFGITKDSDVDSDEKNLLKLTHRLLCIEAPLWYMNANLGAVFKDPEDLRSITDCCPLTLAPELQTVLHGKEPPSFQYLSQLPPPIPNVWAVYAVCMVKRGSPPALYVGSGTDSNKGVITRAKSYESKNHLPRFVKENIDQGYRIVHVGMLCWTPIPSAALRPRALSMRPAEPWQNISS
ncbi:hypothetical protein BLS_004257 [Venturia inaequalis]|uniref:Uncharacterized protein n=1 Tax=Venturia inaequalis TaxID=5025 RepID=A0A8H3Z335_VENIN|nr:hypothetical protein BLS_004257 [Venturia inaequalis]KAE9989547.1 hypothetical protein EG327_002589 [Venturia inaequalis]